MSPCVPLTRPKLHWLIVLHLFAPLWQMSMISLCQPQLKHLLETVWVFPCALELWYNITRGPCLLTDCSWVRNLGMMCPRGLVPGASRDCNPDVSWATLHWRFELTGKIKFQDREWEVHTDPWIFWIVAFVSSWLFPKAEIFNRWKGGSHIVA